MRAVSAIWRANLGPFVGSGDRKRKPWRARRPEDRLLEAYWEQHGGRQTIHAEVKLAGRGKRSKWKSSKTRRLDGVSVRPAGNAGIHRRQGFFDRLREGPPIERVDLIEAKHGASEEAIGQAVAGTVLWRAQYPDIPIEQTIVLARAADPAMRWVCEQLGLTPVVVDSPGIEASNLSKRRTYSLDKERLERVDGYRRKMGGTFVTRVPIGGPDSGWEDSAQVFVNLLRIVGGPVDALVLYDTADRFLALVDDRPVEVIEVRKELKRGAIGKVLAHAAMLAEQYELDVHRRVIVVENSDEALEWVCERVGIVVEVVS
jgi:hypothetical protein